MTQIKRAFRTNKVDIHQAAWHELHAAVGMARTSRLIGAHEEKIVLSAAQLSSRPIREIILPLKDISTLPLETSLTNALLQAHLDLHTRFPVCRVADDPQTIDGYVTFKDIVVTLKMNPSSPSLKSIVRPIKRLPEDNSISRILELMIQEKIHIALVETKDHELLGMVTLEDILEELVGSIEDEFDRLPNYMHTTEAGWIVGGGISMLALADLIHEAPFSEQQSMTLAHWCTQELGRPVQKGEVIKTHGLTIIVRKLRRHQVSEAFIRLEK
jgi:putative hemolysin